MGRDSWDPSQQIQGLKCPSQPNPNKNNIEICSVKLPKKRINLFSQQLFIFVKCLSLFLYLCFSRHSKSICISQVYFCISQEIRNPSASATAPSAAPCLHLPIPLILAISLFLTPILTITITPLAAITHS